MIAARRFSGAHRAPLAVLLKKLIKTIGYAISLAVVASAAAWAQAYPSRPVRYIVPFTPGGSPDIVARTLADRLSRIWGQQMVVDNRAGAAGVVGANLGAKAAPDGYTLFQCNIASNAIASVIYKTLPFDMHKDFAAITRIGTTPNALVVGIGVPAKTAQEFIALARVQPGKLTYGSSGASPYLAMELFKMLTHIDVTSVAYKGAAPALADMMGGQITASVSNLPALVQPVLAGRIRALGVMDAKRAAQWPDVPTMAEAGVNGAEVTSWYGVCAPAGAPQPVLNKLHADFTGVLNSADVRQRFSGLMIDVSPGTPAEFAAFMRAETTRWAQVAKKAGLQPQ